eukprot:UN10840
MIKMLKTVLMTLLKSGKVDLKSLIESIINTPQLTHDSFSPSKVVSVLNLLRQLLNSLLTKKTTHT